MKYRKINIEENEWLARHDLEEKVPFEIEWKKYGVSLSLTGIKAAALDEIMALPLKAVRHDFMEEDGYRVETAAVIPFGEEPAVRRKIEYFGNGIVKVTTDMRMKSSMSGKEFILDRLSLTGDFAEFAVIPLNTDTQFTSLNWKPISAEKSTILEATEVCCIILIRTEEGFTIETGTGFDLWRWNVAEKSTGVQSGLKIEKTAAGIEISRFIMQSDDEFNIPKRDWRFNWYLAWSNTKEEPSEFSENADLCLSDLSIDSSGKVRNSQKNLNAPCLHSKQVRNLLRKWLRSRLGADAGTNLRVSGFLPHICNNPSHLERPKRGALLHWDMQDIIDFWFWANRQLRKNNCSIAISADEASIFKELPSFRVMSKQTPTKMN